MSSRLVLVWIVLLAWQQAASAQVPPPPAAPAPYPYPKAKITGPPTIARNDIHGDPMPAGARARFGSIRLRHSDRVDQVIFSPDGKWLASYCRWEKSIKVWETATGKLRRRLKATEVVKMAFAPDSQALALIRQTSAFTGEILVECWDLATGKGISRIRDDDRQPEDGVLAFSPDGKHLYFGRSCLRCLDLKSSKILFPKEVDPPAEDVTSLAIAPDGSTLVTAHDDGSVRFRDSHTGKDRCRFEGVSVSRLALSTDGKVLALAGPGRLELWQMPPAAKQVAKPSLEKRRLPMEETGAIIDLASSPDATKLLSLSEDSLVCIWDVKQGKCLLRRQLPSFHCGAVAFDAGKRALAVTDDDVSFCLRVWDVAEGEEVFAGRHLGKRVTCMTFSADGKTLVTGSDDKTLRFWQAGNGKLLAKVRLPQVPSQIDFDRDGKHLIVGGNGKWWNIVLAKKEKVDVYLPAAEPFAALPKGSHWHRAASAPSKNKRRGPIPWKIDLVREGTLLPDGLLLEWERQKVRVIEDSGFGKQLFLVQGGKFYGAALAPNRTTLAVLQNDKNETVTLMDVAFGQQLDFKRLSNKQPKLEKLPEEYFAPIRLGGAQRLDGWALPQEEWLPDQPWLLPRIGMVPGNRLLAVGTPRGSVLFWDVATSQQVHKIPDHGMPPVSLLAFSADGKTIACAYWDATVLLWDCPKLSTAPANPVPLKQLWNDLEAAEPSAAWKAHWAMVLGSTKTTSFLKDRLRPVRLVDLKPLPQKIKELDSDQFAVRNRAMKAIESLGLAAEPALLEAQKKPATLEKQRRLKQLLDKVEQTRKRHTLELRALTVLEQIASPEAVAILDSLAAGDPKAPITLSAKATRKRLGKKQGAP